jgi:hypothetical protein
VQLCLRRAALKRRTEILQSTFDRMHAHVTISQRGRSLTAIVTRASGILPCISAVLRWKRVAHSGCAVRKLAQRSRIAAMRRALTRWAEGAGQARTERDASAARELLAAEWASRTLKRRLLRAWATKVRALHRFTRFSPLCPPPDSTRRLTETVIPYFSPAAHLAAVCPAPSRPCGRCDAGKATLRNQRAASPRLVDAATGICSYRSDGASRCRLPTVS